MTETVRKPTEDRVQPATPPVGAVRSSSTGTTAFGGSRRVPAPVNEPVKSYAPGSPEKAEVKARLKQMAGEVVDIPLVIGGREVRTGDLAQTVMPHDHGHIVARWHRARREDVERAIAAAAEAHREWSAWSLEDRAGVLLKAGELLATTWRSTLNASTMLGRISPYSSSTTSSPRTACPCTRHSASKASPNCARLSSPRSKQAQALASAFRLFT